MATSTHVPVEHYLHSSEWEPDAEYVDGEIEERPMGEDEHSALQQAICVWFHQHAEQWNIRVRPELRVQVAATKFLVPDVTILDAAAPREKIALTPPLAVFEVWSPEDTPRRLFRKLGLYQAMGIGQIWTIDPRDEVWQRFVDGRLEDATRFTIPEQGIDFDIDEITKLVW